MPKPTKAQQELFRAVLDSIPFHRSPEAIQPIGIYDIDEVPPEDENGYRRADGVKSAFTATVQESWTNGIQLLHGAATAWLVDTCTSAAIVGISTDRFWSYPNLGGASVSLDMQYFRPIPTGTKLLIMVEILKITVTLAHLSCEIRDLDSGLLYATGMHIKAWKTKPAVKAKL